MTDQRTMTETRELLACPFCGADDVVFGYVDDPTSPDHGGHFIQCPHLSCGASIGLVYAAGDDPRPRLKQQWNTRTAAPDGEGWQLIETAPRACCVLATRLDFDAGEWVVAVVSSPPSHPFTHWRPLPAPPSALAAKGKEQKG